jgi:Virulence-associated protein E
MSDGDDIPTDENTRRLDEKPMWGAPDVATEYIAFLDNAIRMLQPADLFSGQRDSNEWFNLHGPKPKDMLATIHIWMEEHKDHSLVGEVSHKVGIVIALLKKRFNNADIFNGYNKDVGGRIKRLKENSTREKYTPFTIPRGQWTKVNAKGEPVPHNENAIAALKYHFEDEGIIVSYDHWKNSLSVTSLKKSKFPRESKDFIVKNYINQLVGKFKILFTMEEIKFGLGQLAVDKSRHSMLDYFAGLRWDGTKRLSGLLGDIMKVQADDDGFHLSVITKQLVASVRRVRFPGAKYDMCPLLIATEGWNKSTFLIVLYGRRNILSEDILDLSTKEQSEKLRNGIMAVELADTLGDERKSDARKIKAFITRPDDVGRDAYGRVEDVEHIGRTCVYWHTGNNPYLLISEEGNRRFIPFYLTAPMNIDLLRQHKDQIWAEIVEVERIWTRKVRI